MADEKNSRGAFAKTVRFSGRKAMTMRNQLLLAGVASALLLGFAPRPLASSQNIAGNEQFLFNGTSIDSWTIEPSGQPPAQVVDGAIVLKAGSGWLRTKNQKYGRFVLKFSARGTPDARATLALAGRSAPTYETAHAISLLDDRRPDLAKLSGFLVQFLTTTRESFSQALRRGDEWQTYQVTRSDDHISVSLNGQAIADEGISQDADGWIGVRNDRGTFYLRDVNVVFTAIAPLGRRNPNDGIVMPVAIVKDFPSAPKSKSKELGVNNGHSVILLTVEADGTASSPKVIVSANLERDREALKAIPKWRFQPATKDGVAVRYPYYTISFY